jgi:peptide/nickel transport system permease protein
MRFTQFILMRAAMAVFSLMELGPGDCAERYVAFKNTQGSQISIADIEAERHRLGLDRPFVTRGAGWVGNVICAAILAIAAFYVSPSISC